MRTRKVQEVIVYFRCTCSRRKRTSRKWILC